MIDALARLAQRDVSSQAGVGSRPGDQRAMERVSLRRALEFDPGNPDALAKLGRALRNLGRNGEALDAFRAYHEKCRATSREPRKSAPP
jgi:cytochrome c-type biogenesis protein CcmH/NrfG